MKAPIVFSLAVIAALGSAGLYLHWTSVPPTQQKIIGNFQTHRPTFERLRDLLAADQQISRLASWGVETTSSPVPAIPPTGNISVDRYHEYLALMGEVGADGVSRYVHEGHTDLCIYLWAHGFAADISHMAICWLDHEPTDQVDDLDHYVSAPRDHHDPHLGVYKHIDANWYIQEDW